ncbi:MAG: fumarylacetoacetate hydrolase family protein [Bacteroidota bacterium]
MKLFRFGKLGEEKPGIFLNENYYDLGSVVEDINESFFETGQLEKLAEMFQSNEVTLPKIPAESRIGSCVARPSKIVCVGLNYADHAKESGMDIPKEPILFFKSTTALIGPNDKVIIPKNSMKSDWEVELAVVISKKASYVSEEEALDCIAGYCLHNDLSEREFQLERGGTWDKGKGCDTFAPIGPILVTPDEIEEVDNLNLWLTVNGQTMQNSSTQQLIFKVPFLIHYISQFMTLLPGDVISTGTPPGVGLGFKPPIFLKAGDVIELGIEGLGSQRQEVVAYEN